jgi:hypothetical protein
MDRLPITAKQGFLRHRQAGLCRYQKRQAAAAREGAAAAG